MAEFNVVGFNIPEAFFKDVHLESIGKLVPDSFFGKCINPGKETRTRILARHEPTILQKHPNSSFMKFPLFPKFLSIIFNQIVDDEVIYGPIKPGWKNRELLATLQNVL